MSKQAAKRVGLHMWRKDGEPEAGERQWGRSGYIRVAEDVIAAMVEMGYRIVRPQDTGNGGDRG